MFDPGTDIGLRHQILTYYVGDLLTDVERARLLGLPEGPATLTVIGGAGFLGRALIEGIAGAPGFGEWEVRCVDRVPYPASADRPTRFVEVVADASGDRLTSALRGDEMIEETIAFCQTATVG
jgi:hypothetical protein